MRNKGDWFNEFDWKLLQSPKLVGILQTGQFFNRNSQLPDNRSSDLAEILQATLFLTTSNSGENFKPVASSSEEI